MQHKRIFHLPELIIQHETQKKAALSLKEISQKTSVPVDVLQKMYKSHIYDTSEIKIRDVINVALFFGAQLEELISYNAVPVSENDINQKGLNIISKRGDEKENPLKNSRCDSSDSFYKAISGSKYLNFYLKVPNLIKEIGNVLDENNDVLAGTGENFNIKFSDEAVLISFTVNGGKIKINNKLRGKSLKLNGDKRYYLDLFDNYVAIKGNDFVESHDDVKNLVSSLKTILEGES